MTDIGSEYGRLLAERDRLIAGGVDPEDLEVPLPPPVLLTCPECGSQLLGQVGQSIAHDDDGSHVWYPAKEA